MNGDFFRTGVRDETNKLVTSYLISCCHCSNQDHLHVRTRSGTLPLDVISRKFKERGWELGSNRRNDTCPQCVTRLSAKGRQPGGFTTPPPQNQKQEKQAVLNGLLRELNMIRAAFREGRDLDALPRRLTAVEETAARMQGA